MANLNKAINKTREAKEVYRQAKWELDEAILSTIEEKGGMFARDIANEGRVSTAAVIGTLQSLEMRGHLVSNREKKETTYVRLDANGEVDLNDMVIKRYSANKYYLPEQVPNGRRR